MKQNDKAIEALADVLQHHGVHHGWFPKGLPSDWRELDPIGRDEFLAIAGDLANAAYAAQFQSEDYAELIKQLRQNSLFTDSVNEELLFLSAADTLEALLAERDTYKNWLDNYEKQFAAKVEELVTVRLERDALLARLAPVDDKALVEIAVKTIFNPPSQTDEHTKRFMSNRARAAIAAIRPHIEAMERERRAKIADNSPKTGR